MQSPLLYCLAGLAVVIHGACILPFSQVLRDIQPRGFPIQSAKRIPINVPWTKLVSPTGSTPLIPVPNDGLVTLRSMRCRTDIQIVDVNSNHFEMVLHPHALTTIRREVEHAQLALSRRIVLHASCVDCWTNNAMLPVRTTDVMRP